MKRFYFHLFAFLFLFIENAHAIEPQVSTGRSMNMTVDSNGAVYLWRAPDSKAVRYTSQYGKYLWLPGESPTKVVGLPRMVAVSAGIGDFVDSLAEDGSIYEWGYGPYQNHRALTSHPWWGFCELVNLGGGPGTGPCGMDEKDFHTAFLAEKPQKLAGVPAASAIAAGEFDVLALTRDSEVYCWNSDKSPSRIPGLSNVIAIGVGDAHGIALQKDGSVITWGRNDRGPLGIPSAPSQIYDHSLCDGANLHAVFADAIGVYATGQNSYAWRADGSVWGWGGNRAGILGMDQKTVWLPTQIATVAQINDLAAGPLHIVARTSDDKVYVWGSNAENRLAQDANVKRSAIPINLASLDGVASMSTHNQTLTVTRDGYVCAWGLAGIAHAIPIMLADEKTALNLKDGNASQTSEPTDLCGNENWHSHIAEWKEAAKQIEQRRKMYPGG
jgi:alpha-tubulin suppressor-like RCC1 family protein